MKNSKLILSIAAVAAVAAGVALIVAKKRTPSLVSEEEEAKEHYGSRLKKLQRKAQKEFKDTGSNTAMERAGQWAGHIPGGLR